MINFDSIHREEFSVQTSCMDPRQTVRMPAYLDMMQEAAGSHSSIYSLTIPDLLKQDKTWMITRQKIRITGYPPLPPPEREDQAGYMDSLTDTTGIPQSIHRLRQYRPHDIPGSRLLVCT